MRTAPVMIACLAVSAAAPVRADAPSEGVLDFATFKAALAPFGEWVALSPYGEVWRPAGVPSDWRPYFDGWWTWTEDGWFWVSDEPWAWATYHYGRWLYDPTLGWVWEPGYDWAPAWVAWRFGDGYVGWAPLYPGAAQWWLEYPVPVGYWCFVPEARFVGVPVRRAFVPSARVGEIFHRTKPAPPPGHRTAPAPPFGGPPRASVEAVLGRRLVPTRIVPSSAPPSARSGRQEGTVSAYRPRGVARSPAPPSPGRPPAAPPAAAPRATPPSAVPGASPAPPPAQPHPRGEEERGRR